MVQYICIARHFETPALGLSSSRTSFLLDVHSSLPDVGTQLRAVPTPTSGVLPFYSPSSETLVQAQCLSLGLGLLGPKASPHRKWAESALCHLDVTPGSLVQKAGLGPSMAPKRGASGFSVKHNTHTVTWEG